MMIKAAASNYKISNKKLAIAFGVIFIIHLFFAIYHFNQPGTPEFSEAESTKMMIGMLLVVLILIPLFCLLLSLVIALFVNKDVSYMARLRRVFLWILIIVNTAMVIRVLIELLFGI